MFLYICCIVKYILAALPTDADGFMNVPEGVMEELPFARPEVKTDADKGSKKNR